jgi:peptide-methionine (R)-S-oxide reductase
MAALLVCGPGGLAEKPVMAEQKPEAAPDESGLLPVPENEAQWRRRLTRKQYQVLRQAATEPAFRGEYWDCKKHGVYRCAGCGQPLFSSETKFKSGTGWPSFYAPLDKQAVATRIDRRGFVPRMEVHCARCGGHLGHVFSDGPRPTGLRFCLNSAALKLEETPSEAGK